MEQERQCKTQRSEMCAEIMKMLDNASLDQICIITLLVRGMLGQLKEDNAK